MKNKQLLLKNSSSQYKVLQGFTLVELSLTIAIVAGLTTAVVSVMNPVELSAQMRDGQRIAAMGTLRETLGVLIAENPNLPTGFGLTNFAYISLPDTHSDCRNIITNLPARTDGRLYHCVTAANLMRIDGAGWIPVNFTTIRGGSPISILPIDPINNTSFFYEYLPSAHHRYAFSTRIESIRQRAQNPSGIFTTRFTAPFNFGLSASPSAESIVPGGSIFTTITTSLISGTTREVSFSASGLPTGAVATFSPTNCSPLCSSTLNIITNTNTPVGIHNVAVIATSAKVTRETIYVMSIANTLSFLLSTSVIGTGTVTSSPAGINCTSGICNAAYTSGTSVTLTATPGANHTFAGWSGACTGTGSCALTMSEARSVAATFSQIPAPTVSISASPTSITSGSSSTITWSSTNASSCSWTSGFTGSATLLGSQSTGALTATTTYTLSCAGAGGTTLNSTTVTITVAPTFTLTTSVTGSGTITSSPAGINCGADCTESYASGTSVTLTATPGANHTFAGWSGACTGTGSCVVSMTQARSVTATFNQITHNLAVTISGTGTVTGTGINCPGDCSETFAQGTNVSLTATPGANHTFAGWSGACTGTGACVVSITTTQSVGASFTQQMVFVYYIYTTNTIHTGNLGGRTGADNICNLSINRPPVCSRGWAFMSFSATDEIRDFPENAQTLSGLPLNQSAIWRSQTGTHSGVQIAGNWWDLTDGTIATPLVNGGAAAWYWTGTTSVFTQHNTCTGWITDQATLAGVVGDGSQAWNPWIFSGSPTCNNAHHVLCACF